MLLPAHALSGAANARNAAMFPHRSRPTSWRCQRPSAARLNYSAGVTAGAAVYAGIVYVVKRRRARKQAAVVSRAYTARQSTTAVRGSDRMRHATPSCGEFGNALACPGRVWNISASVAAVNAQMPGPDDGLGMERLLRRVTAHPNGSTAA
jgi:hypothetical protein